jgi:hypothetical protein
MSRPPPHLVPLRLLATSAARPPRPPSLQPRLGSAGRPRATRPSSLLGDVLTALLWLALTSLAWVPPLLA